MVELGLNDYLDIFCPHYEGPGPRDICFIHGGVARL